MGILNMMKRDTLSSAIRQQAGEETEEKRPSRIGGEDGG
jgi:hypothetical protein